MGIGCVTRLRITPAVSLLLQVFIISSSRQAQAFLVNRHRLIHHHPRQLSGRVSIFAPIVSKRTAPPRFMSSSSAAASAAAAAAAASKLPSSSLCFVDIGANLLEERFTAGIYRGTFRHKPDLPELWQRAHGVGCRRIILTAGTLEESRLAVQQARDWNAHADNPGILFFSTVGIHPTRCQQELVDAAASADDILQELVAIAVEGQSDGTVVAIGELGLDYDRLEFCSKEVQHEFFVRQLQTLAATTKLPLFLHNRSVGRDLYDLLVQHEDCWKSSAGGVVHSFDDTAKLATAFTDLGFYIGLNGCSLRTEESLAVVRDALPLDRILLETDAPYCEVRATHPGHKYIQTTWPAKAEKKFERGFTVKNRQEPCHIIQIAEVVAAVKQVALAELAQAVYQNSCRLYGWTADNDEA